MFKKLKKNALTVLLLALPIVLSNCAPSNNTIHAIESTDKPLIQTQVSKNRENFNYWAVHDPTLPDGMTRNEFLILDKRFREESYEKYYQITRDIMESPTWQIADQHAKEYLRMTENHYYAFCIQQEVASTMLRTFFMDVKPNEEVIAAITFYMNILQKYQYYREVNLFIQILPKFKGFWTEQQIQELANLCVQSYNRRYSKNITAETYFKNLAEKQIAERGDYIGSAQAQTADKSQVIEKLKKDFQQTLSTRAESYKHLKQSEWFHPKDENIVTLSLITDR